MPKRYRTAALIVFFVPVWIVCAVIVGQYYVHSYEAYDKGTSAEERKFYLEVADLLAQWLMAGGALALLFFTVRGVRAAFKTFKQAQKSNDIASQALGVAQAALEQAKRSVDAFIDKERGRLAISQCRRPDNRSATIVYSYTNVGGSELTVMSFGAIPVLYVMGEGFNVPEIPTVAVPSIVVKQGDEFGGVIQRGLFSHGLPGSFDVPYEMFMRVHGDPRTRLLAAFKIIYTTALGRYVKQQVFLLEAHGPMDIMHKDLCYDLPYSEWLERYGHA